MNAAKTFLRFTLALAVAAALPAQAQTRLTNKIKLRKEFGLKDYSVASTLGAIKIAVLDNGFTMPSGMQFENVDGQQILPPSTKVIVASPDVSDDDKSAPARDPHGLGMAQILWGTLDNLPVGPELHLINANGFFNFKWAVDYVIEHNIDIVLYAQTWDFFGNFDGRGFVNAQVDRAVDAGVLWLSAAGNVGGAIYDDDLRFNSATGYARLPGPGDTLRFNNLVDSNNVTIILNWNDYRDVETYKSTKDLDLHLFNEAGTEIPLANKIQRGESPDPTVDGDKRSAYSRESFRIMLDRGEYTIKIEDRSKNFGSNDRFRVLVTAENPSSVKFTDAVREREIAIPADNPRVITIGDCTPFSAQGPTVDGRFKPDIVLRTSQAQFTDGKTTYGTSNATAMFAGVIGTLMAAEPEFKTSDLKRYIKSLQEKADRDQPGDGRIPGLDQSSESNADGETSSNSNSNQNSMEVPASQLKCGKTAIWKTPTPAELVQIVR